MRDTIIPAGVRLRERPRASWLQRVASSLVGDRLGMLEEGQVTLVDGDRAASFGCDCGLSATVYVQDPEVYVDLAFGGSLGAAESYIAGRWLADDLTALIRIFARNLDVSDKLERGWARPASWIAQKLHRLRANTRAGSARNIRAHYDLGNDFFELFLDPTMSYSCGIFETPRATLEEASIAKMDRICRKLDLQPNDRLLEIGTGWGAMAIHAAKRYGCRVTTTTISEQQRRLAVERVRRAGLEDRVTVLLEDYRDLEGAFDKIVSVEMIEAVGHEFLEDYFERCSRLLTRDGLMLLQGITIADHRYERYRREVDFINRFVFPGSCLPSVTALCSAASRASDLRPAHLEDFTPHYAETLRRWRAAFQERLDEVRALGYSDEFIRLWDFYLCYCEAGFEEGTCGEVQLMFAKPRRRRQTLDPAARRAPLEVQQQCAA